MSSIGAYAAGAVGQRVDRGLADHRHPERAVQPGQVRGRARRPRGPRRHPDADADRRPRRRWCCSRRPAARSAATSSGRCSSAPPGCCPGAVARLLPLPLPGAGGVVRARRRRRRRARADRSTGGRPARSTSPPSRCWTPTASPAALGTVPHPGARRRPADRAAGGLRRAPGAHRAGLAGHRAPRCRPWTRPAPARCWTGRRCTAATTCCASSSPRWAAATARPGPLLRPAGGPALDPAGDPANVPGPRAD